MEVLAALVAALGLAFPISCASPEAWAQALADYSLPATGVTGYYLPRAGGGPEIVMGPYVCSGYRTDKWTGFAWVLAHELRHSQQDEQGLPPSEADADAWATANWQTLAPYVAAEEVAISKPPVTANRSPVATSKPPVKKPKPVKKKRR